jgi:hypothetical protein
VGAAFHCRILESVCHHNRHKIRILPEHVCAKIGRRKLPTGTFVFKTVQKSVGQNWRRIRRQEDH